MHAYLVVSKDLQAFLFTNLIKAKDKEEELGECFVYTWINLWGKPMNFTKNSDSYCRIDNSKFPWEMLIKAYEQGNWNAKCKCREELFKNIIEQLSE